MDGNGGGEEEDDAEEKDDALEPDGFEPNPLLLLL